MSDVYIYNTKNTAEHDLNNRLEQIIRDIFIETNCNVQGKKVLVKPNMLIALEPSRGATTDPRLIRALVNVLRENGAAQILVGDGPGGVENGMMGTAKITGILEAADGCFVNFNQKVKMIPLNSKYVKRISISAVIEEVDIIINLPKIKTHAFTGISGCIKNMFGIVAGPGKARLHFKAPSVEKFSELLLDIYQIRVPDLHIVDGLIAMEGNGPTIGPLKKMDVVVAGRDGIAIDTVLAKMLGYEANEIKHLPIAKARGLGENDFNRIQVHGELVQTDFQRPVTYVTNKMIGSAVASEGLSYIYQVAKAIPKLIKPDSCTRCRQCVVSCPAQAIVLAELPQIDNRKCISCFCCSELCPHHCYEILTNIEMFYKMYGGLGSDYKV